MHADLPASSRFPYLNVLPCKPKLTSLSLDNTHDPRNYNIVMTSSGDAS